MTDRYFLSSRLRALRGRFLSREDYETILNLPDLPSFLARLRDGPYGAAVEAAGEADSDIVRVEEGLRRNLSDTLIRLSAVSTGAAHDAVEITAGFFDLDNLKTILRGKSAGLGGEEILPALLPAGWWDEPALEELCRQPDLRGVTDLLASWRDPRARVLRRAVRDYRDPRDLFVLESALDRDFFREALGKLGRAHFREADREALREFIALRADRNNLMTVLQALEEGLHPVDGSRYFLEGGRLFSRKDFSDLLAAGRAEGVLARAARSVFREPLKGRTGPEGEGPELSSVERALDRFILRAMRRRMRVDPLGMAAVVVTVLDKILETANLRMILRGLLAGLSDSDLREHLILDY